MSLKILSDLITYVIQAFSSFANHTEVGNLLGSTICGGVSVEALLCAAYRADCAKCDESSRSSLGNTLERMDLELYNLFKHPCLSRLVLIVREPEAYGKD